MELPSTAALRVLNGDAQSPWELPCEITAAEPVSRARTVLIHATAVAVVCILRILSDTPWIVLVLGGSVMFVTYLRLGLAEARRSPLLLTPLSYYFFWCSVNLGVAAVYMGIQISSGAAIPFVTAGWSVAPQDAATAYVIYLLGSVALHAGMHRSRPGGVGEKAAKGPDLRLAIRPLAMMYIVGLLDLLHPSLLAPLGGSLSGPFAFAALAALSCLALASPAELGVGRAAFAGVLMIGTALLFYAAINSSSKGFMMFSLVPLLWRFYHDRSLRRWLPFVIAGGIAMYSIVYQVQTVARNYTQGYYSQSTPYLTIMQEAYKEWRRGEVVGARPSVEEQVDQLLRRLFDPTPVGCVLELVREGGFRMGETMTYGFYSVVPRILWANKPEVPKGAWFTSFLGGGEALGGRKVYVCETAVGELYWNFGLPGVFGGMYLIGILLGRLWKMAGSDPHRQPVRMLLYVSIMLNMTNMPEAVTTVTSIVASFLVFGTAFWTLRVLRTRGSTKALSDSWDDEDVARAH